MSKKVIFGGVTGMTTADVEKMQRYVREEHPEAEVCFYGEKALGKEELLKIGKGAEVLISWDQEMDEEAYQNLDLVAYCAASVGFNAANIEAATKNGVYVSNVPDYCTQEVAAHTVALMLAMYRWFYKMIGFIKEGNWGLGPMAKIQRFENSTVGLLGLGRIGKAVAKKLSGFGVQILSYDPYVSEEEMQKFGVKKASLEELFEKADYLSIHCPLTAETKKLVSRENIGKMKDGAYLINTARGGVVDEEALYEALSSGKIQGAGLDVLEKEPPSELGKKIIALENVIVTGHSAYASMEASDEQIRMTAQNVALYLSGKVPEGALNRKEVEEKLSGMEN